MPVFISYSNSLVKFLTPLLLDSCIFSTVMDTFLPFFPCDLEWKENKVLANHLESEVCLLVPNICQVLCYSLNEQNRHGAHNQEEHQENLKSQHFP